ncbi:MAG: helix-turn-helix domain-containing protein [Proteobacteria bacterium]|nr:helix-turn-helix domain-containing protein [Pseudomonadota bacterium]
MPKGYTHLTYGQRCHISAYLQGNFSQKEIAAKLNISPSTLSREIRKNCNKDGCYAAKTTHKRAKKRKVKCY